MGKIADQIKTDCCGSLLDDKAQLVRDVAALELYVEEAVKVVTAVTLELQALTKKVIVLKAERDMHLTTNKDTCRTVFDAMYTAAPKYKEQIWANLCLTLGIDA